MEVNLIRACRLVLQAHQDLQLKEQEKLLISHLITGKANDKLAQHIITVYSPTVAEAERIATFSEVLQEFQRTKRSAWCRLIQYEFLQIRGRRATLS